MTERDRVLDAFRNCITEPKCKDCPWTECSTLDNGNVEIPRDLALAVMRELVAQEPRVMTWQEVIGAAIECKPLYVEVKDSEDKEPGDDRWAMATPYKDSITNGMIRVMSSYITSEVFFKDRYGKTWRCWTSRPTAEQMEATLWNL